MSGASEPSLTQTSNASHETTSAYPWAKRTTIRGHSREPVLCVRFTPDDTTVIVAHYDGHVIAYDVQTFAVRFDLVIQVHGKANVKTPVTSICIRPTGKPVMVVTSTSGMVEKYDTRSLDRLCQFVEDDNEVYASDYSPTGALFATCGRDATLRVYDDNTNDLVRTFKLAPDYPTNAAALRLFAVRFDPQHSRRLYTGGWSNTLHLHDLDEVATHDLNGDHRHEFFGAYITGDALDIAKENL